MTITAQSVIRRAVETLQDNTSIRWPVGELVRYLNDGQREVVMHRPDALVKNASVILAEGTKQRLATGTGAGGVGALNLPAKLIEVVRNSGGTKRPVRLVIREILDAQIPGWHSLTGATDIMHFMFDPRDPLTFYVYPPAASTGAALDLVYGAYPTDVTEPTSGDYTSVSGNIDLLDIHGNALLDYILYRAYSKDSEYAGNAQRAVNHYTAFMNALGIEIKATLAVAPTTRSNPNHPGASSTGAQG